MFSRVGTDRESFVLNDLLTTGHLAGVPLKKATLTDLNNAKAEARLAHIADGLERQRQKQLESGVKVVEPVIITVYKGNVEKTVRALKNGLGGHEFEALVTHLIANQTKAWVGVT